MQKIATIINFCSNDYPFLKHCISHVKPVSQQILIPVCDHFFDGTKEDQAVLNGIYAEHLDCNFIQYQYDPDQIRIGPKNRGFWHNLSRLIGWYFVHQEIDMLLFLDADEIIDDNFFYFPQRPFDAQRLACYWYFKESTFRAKTWEDTPLLVNKNFLSVEKVMDVWERGGMPAERFVTGPDKKPMVHHYSWVRTKEQVLKKVTTWGHKNDRNWVDDINTQWNIPFSGRDFVHGYEYEIVEPFIQLELSKQLPSSQKIGNNVSFLTTDQIHRIELELQFGIH